MNLLEYFECPKCSGNHLEEVLVNVVEWNEVTTVEDGMLDYGHHNTDGGTVDRYQCMNCGWKIAGDEEELIEVLEGMKGKTGQS